jgi:hypothetical protein
MKTILLLVACCLVAINAAAVDDTGCYYVFVSESVMQPYASFVANADEKCSAQGELLGSRTPFKVGENYNPVDNVWIIYQKM